MAVLGIILFVVIGAVILTGAGMLIANWHYPEEKIPGQQDVDKR